MIDAGANGPDGRSSPEEPAGEAPRWRYERADRAARNVPWRRNLRRVRRAVAKPFVLTLAPLLVRLLGWTWRKTAVHGERRDALLKGDESCIAILWHGRMLAAVPQFRDIDARVLVSMSGDGDLALDLLQRFGYGTLRGSTSRSGSRALREMIETLRGSITVVITPDGPRGPRHSVSRGPAFLARETGLPIVAVGFAADRAWYLKSWDRFAIPKPFARVGVSYAEPLRIAADATDDELRATGARLHELLVTAEEEAFAAVGAPVDW